MPLPTRAEVDGAPTPDVFGRVESDGLPARGHGAVRGRGAGGVLQVAVVPVVMGDVQSAVAAHLQGALMADFSNDVDLTLVQLLASPQLVAQVAYLRSSNARS